MEREADKRKLHPFRQVLRLNKTSTGRISSRPTIMHRDMTSLDRGEKMEKFPAGPMSSSPGPTLLTQVRAAEKETEKEKLSREMIRAPVRMTRK